jgi:NAD(P)H-flavin reductase
MNDTATAPAKSPWRTHSVRIMEIIPEIDGVATYRLCADEEGERDAYQFQEGQFNMLYLPGVGESAISMSGDAASRDGWIHTVRIAGNVTRSLASLQCGETLGVRGPFGTGWPMEQLVGTDVIIVAGGLGLAPIRPVIYHLIRHRALFGSIELIIGARTPDGLLFQREYDHWLHFGMNIQVTVDRGTAAWTGNIGVVTTLLDRMAIADPARCRVITCGPEVMMKYAALAAIHRGIAADRIWISMERNMQCATGLCGHCQLGPAFICKDGPVLRYDRLQPYLFVESL